MALLTNALIDGQPDSPAIDFKSIISKSIFFFFKDD